MLHVNRHLGFNAGGVATDPLFADVKLLIHADTSITDVTGKTVTANGNAAISSTTKKFGAGSVSFDGTGDYLSVANSTDWDFGTGDFTIECEFFQSGNGNTDNNGNHIQGIFSTYSSSSTNWVFLISGNSTNSGTGLQFINNVDTTVAYTGTISQNTWHHLAVTRSSGTVHIWLDGVSVASGSMPSATNSNGNPLLIGRMGFLGFLEEFQGCIDEMRITKGVARYTANFTPPSSAFPDK